MTPSCRVALCAEEPGAGSGRAAAEPGAAVTCPACLRRLGALERPGHDSLRRSDVRRIPRALLVVVNGGLLLVSLGSLLGVWYGRTGGT